MARRIGDRILPTSKRGKASRASEQSSDLKELWSRVAKYRDIGLRCRTPFEQRWIVNIAFFSGRQYTFFNQSTMTLQQLKRVKGRIRNTDNQLGWRVRRQISDLIKNKPEMSVVPSTHDSDDRKAAKMGDKVLGAWWLFDEMKMKLRQLGGWIYTTGNGFLDDRWDPKKGKIIVDPQSGEVEYEGNATCGVWSPFEIGVPFTAMGSFSLQSFPWVWKMKYYTLDEIAGMYEKGKLVTSETIPQGNSSVMHIMGSGVGMGDAEIPGALVIDLYVKPNEVDPKGLFVTASNGIILQQDTYPLNHYHLEHFKDIDIPGFFWGKATMEDGVPLQKTWNANTSSMEEYNKSMGKGKWMAPRGANLETKPDDTHGQIIKYTPVLGHKPDDAVGKGLPSTYDKEQERIQFSLENLFNQHEVTRGTNRADIRSEDMLAFLREQDRQGSMPTHLILEEGLERVASRVLRRIQEGYSDERMLKIRGEEGEFEVFPFKGADLRDNTDVSIKRESSVPESRASLEQLILRKFEIGYYGHPQDPKTKRTVQRMLDDAVHKDIYSEEILDETYSRYENEVMMKTGKELPVNLYDSHSIHLQEHAKFLKGMDFQKLKFRQPEAFERLSQVFQIHLNEHTQMLTEQQEASMRKQAKFQAMLENAKGGEKGGSNKASE